MNTILSDKQIKEYCLKDKMIHPYVDHCVRQDNLGPEGQLVKVVSYGSSSFGYDIRLSLQSFKLFNAPSVLNDVKNSSAYHFEEAVSNYSADGTFFLLPPTSYGLGISLERFKMPKSVTGVCYGKSTYARAGLLTNVTPIEAGWEGYLTMCLINPTSSYLKLYANEGICQVLFFEGSECAVGYNDRQGKYQDQNEQVVFARVS